MTKTRWMLAMAVASFIPASWAATTGSITGTVKDQSGAVIPRANITVTNTAQGIQTKTTSDSSGLYTFPSLTVGRYDLHAEADGFKPQNKAGITVDLDAVVQIDLSLELAARVEEITVSDTATVVQVETASTQLGEVVTGKEMTAV